MAKRYKIHPGIGIARLGNSPEDFFIGPEVPGGPSLELTPAGEGPVATYKDAAHRIKRQGVRFRVWAYEVDDAGRETPVGEITAPEATIVWHVRLANSKGAGRRILETGNRPRNPNTPTADLVIAPEFEPISGANQRVNERVVGRFKGVPVPLGELRTDALGRLIVLGGSGRAASVPAGRRILSFANNPDWHDDVADGAIDAELRFPDGTIAPVDRGAWVVVAPPDFAPGVLGLATLYDIALDAAVKRGWVQAPARPSFAYEVLPIIERAAKLRWVNQFAYWNSISRDFALLGRLGDAAADALRAEVYAQLIDVQDSGILNNFQYTDRQRAILDSWANGIFIDDFGAPAPAVALSGPAALDRAALDQGVGGGFFPGIEAGILTTNPYLYSELCRFTREPFIDNNETLTLRAGSITERMAVPWQADFLKCNSMWWPAQRPDDVFIRPSDMEPTANWIDGISTHEDLAANFWRLGFVTVHRQTDGTVMYLETERDPGMPRAGV
jgi:hypothetical protein